MRRFIFLIGRDNEFENGRHLIETYLGGGQRGLRRPSMSSYDVDLPADLKLKDYNGLHEIALSIMMGEAMKDCWHLDLCVSVLLELTDGGLQAWAGDIERTTIPIDPDELAALVY